ncbi:MAG: DnaA regulatory inactivator Hda [Xanthomonadaceae bacterium]|nr:DnaA regulatory inactivator Hda [Xanthomonadaceae bacterium]
MTAPQLPLALPFSPDQRLDAFVGSVAECALLAAVAQGGQHDWLMLSGASGSGKTHLLLAACAEAATAGRRAVYLNLADRPEHVDEALQALEGADLICLDTLDAVAGRREVELSLFNFHNRARASGAVIAYAARQVPAGLALSLPDLRSRLSQCVQLPLAALDEAGRREVLNARAARRGLSLDAPVLDYLLARVGRDLTTLTELLDRLDRESLAAQRRITVPFLRQILAQSATR